MTDRPRIDSVTGSFMKRGRCKVCGKQAYRSRSFTADTYESMLAKSEKWAAEPVLHAKCELLWDPERGVVIGAG